MDCGGLSLATASGGQLGQYLHLGLEDALDFVSLQQSAEITVGHLGLWQAEVVLGERLGLECAVDLIETLERRLGPNAESAQMTTGGNLQQVETLNVEQCDTLTARKSEEERERQGE